MRKFINILAFLLIAGIAMFSACPEQEVPPPVKYTITVTQPAAGGSFTVAVGSSTAVSGNTQAAEGETITLTATPAADFDFSGFTLSPAQTLSGSGLTQTFTMPAEAVAVTAVFTDQNAEKFAITVTQPATGGTFTVAVGNGSAVSDSTEAEEGETITLTATPATDFDFSGFTLDPLQTLSGTGLMQTFTMPGGAVSVTVVFTAQAAEKFAITVTQPATGGTFTVAVGSGTAGSGNTEAAEGVTITLAASPAAGFSFTSFTVTPTQALTGDGNTQTFTMPDEAVAVTAVFTAIPKYAITVTQPATGGTFTVAVGSGTAGSGNTEAAAGETITLAASPAAGFGLTSFTVTPSQTLSGTGNTQTFNMPSEAVTVTAVFAALPKYAITVNQPATGGSFTVAVGSGTAGAGNTEATAGETITLSATPDSGYNFGSFTLTPSQSLSGSGNTRTFVMPAAAVTVTAVFNVQGSGTGTKTLTVVGGVGKVPKFASPEGDDIWERTRHITVTVELEDDIIKTVVLDHELTRYWLAINNKGNAGWAYGSSWYNSRIGLANFINNANTLASSIASSNNPDVAHTYSGGASGASGDYTGAWTFHAAAIRQAVKDAITAINQSKPNRVLAGGGLSGSTKVPWTADGVPLSGTETLTGTGYMSGNTNPTTNATPTDLTARVVVTDGFISEVTVLAAGELNCTWSSSAAQTGFRTRWPNEIITKNAWEDAAGPVDATSAATVSRDSLVWIVKKAVQKMAYEY